MRISGPTLSMQLGFIHRPIGILRDPPESIEALRQKLQSIQLMSLTVLILGILGIGEQYG